MRKFAAICLLACTLFFLLSGCRKVVPDQQSKFSEESQPDRKLKILGYEQVDLICTELSQGDLGLPEDLILKEVGKELSKYGDLLLTQGFSLTGNITGIQEGITSLLFQGNTTNQAEHNSYISFTIQVSKTGKRVALPQMLEIDSEFVSLVRDKALEQSEGALYDELSRMEIADWKKYLLSCDSPDSRNFTVLVGSSTLSVLFFLPDGTGGERVMPVVHLTAEEYRPFLIDTERRKQ